MHAAGYRDEAGFWAWTVIGCIWESTFMLRFLTACLASASLILLAIMLPAFISGQPFTRVGYRWAVFSFCIIVYSGVSFLDHKIGWSKKKAQLLKAGEKVVGQEEIKKGLREMKI